MQKRQNNRRARTVRTRVRGDNWHTDGRHNSLLQQPADMMSHVHVWKPLPTPNDGYLSR